MMLESLLEVDMFKICEITKITLHKKHDWFICLLDDSEDQGIVSIYSSFGSWCFNWNRKGRGDVSTSKFLISTDLDYLSSKFNVKKEVDINKTAEALKISLQEKYENLNLEYEHLDQLDLVISFENQDISLEYLCDNIKLDEPWYDVVEEYDKSWNHMWDLFWIDFKNELRAIIESEQKI